LDRVNRRAVRLDGQDRARLHGVAVQTHRACAALGGIASDMRTSNAEFLAQEVNEQLPGLDLGPPLFTVHRDGDVMTWHFLLPLQERYGIRVARTSGHDLTRTRPASARPSKASLSAHGGQEAGGPSNP